MSNESVLNEEARSALTKMVNAPLVYLIPGDPRDEPPYVGSGTLLRTAEGTLLVLTARHVVEDAEMKPMRMGTTIEGRWATNDVMRAFEFAPDGRDVALVALRRDLAPGLLDRAIGLDALARPTEDAFQENDWHILSGFPSTLAIQAATKTLLLGSITYTCTLDGEDKKGRIRALWTEAIMTTDVPPLSPLQPKPGEVFPLPRPHGTSGGALWRFRQQKDLTYWEPRGLSRIIGVPSAYREHLRDVGGIEFCEPVAPLHEWIEATAAKFDLLP